MQSAAVLGATLVILIVPTVGLVELLIVLITVPVMAQQAANGIVTVSAIIGGVAKLKEVVPKGPLLNYSLPGSMLLILRHCQLCKLKVLYGQQLSCLS